MSKLLSLHDHTEYDFPEVVKKIVLGEIRLFVLITAKTRRNYFLPESDFDSFEDVSAALCTFQTGLSEEYWAEAYEAQSGKYEILEADYIAEELEKILKLATNPNMFRDTSEPYEIAISSLRSSSGEKGFMVNVEWLPDGDPKITPVKVLFSRILVEEISSAYKPGQYPINTPEYAAVMEVWEKYWKDGSGMSQDAIVAELMENGRFSKKKAEAIEIICRPLNARGGGRKKSK